MFFLSSLVRGVEDVLIIVTGYVVTVCTFAGQSTVESQRHRGTPSIRTETTLVGAGEDDIKAEN